MSIRDELAQLVADTQCGGRSNPMVKTDFLIADAILSRFGVVELPESLPIPDGYTSDDNPTKCVGVFPWSGMLGELSVWDDGRIHDDIGGMTVEEARRDAASLLAAAKCVEEAK